MNRSIRIATVVLSLAAAGSAFAESPTPESAVLHSSLTRAQVQADVQQARAAGTLVATELQLNQAADVRVSRSRDDVRAETLAAIASGEVQALSTESNAFGHPFVPARRASVLTRMASAGR